MSLRSLRFIILNKTLTPNPKKHRLLKASTEIDHSSSENEPKSFSSFSVQEKRTNRNNYSIVQAKIPIFEVLVLLMFITSLISGSWYFYSEMRTFLLSDFVKVFRTLK
ncbi:hypothetical protein IQ229_21465 [Nostoc cf. edaphicum LEGE 07299]|uniref:Uncharacterized protein n=1 Tax=Nostoc cf. edaphicum LEGE 07299 TaxID=2777974 RepID=A0ABR9U458_9NOSO|nr:hypothetical protein [Nostoc edaphicum]MBE9107403.1 hypothetical protein [Nostoc cf. edaphicum LEGE 07299]